MLRVAEILICPTNIMKFPFDVVYRDNSENLVLIATCEMNRLCMPLGSTASVCSYMF